MAEQSLPTYRRPVLQALVSRMREPRRFIQVIAGPRQAGKTTLARQLMEALDRPCHYATADVPGLRGHAWIEQQWEIGRMRAADGAALLVLDEVQKLTGWSEVVKLLWDADSQAGTNLGVVLLGSAPLLIQAGLTESLAGRFELLRVAQWSYGEMREAFGWDVDHYVYFGGYPGAAPLIGDEGRWAAYIRDSLIETTVSRDILLMRRIDKPALLRQLFELGCRCSGQVVSYTKMLGQLHDAGNTTTLAHYLELLSGAGLLSGLPKYTRGAARKRASSPKLQVHDTALVTATSGRTFREARSDPAWWGRLVESAAGAHLLREARTGAVDLSYWREGSRDVDFVLRRGDRVTAIEVKSSHTRDALPGMDAFARVEPGCRKLLAGPDGLPLGELLTSPVGRLV